MDVQREFARRPPTEPLTSLDAIVRDWQMRTAPGGGLDLKRDDVVEWCREAPSWRVAVSRAVASRRPNGKMHNHQSKVKEADRSWFGDLIEREWPKPNNQWPSSFDTFHGRLEEIRPRGVGPVTTYDVAIRIGAFLKLEPESLYLHAGVKQGWLALCPVEPFGVSLRWRGVDRVPCSMWPTEFNGWKADELEDFLCTYRELFRSIREAGWRAPWEGESLRKVCMIPDCGCAGYAHP